MSHKQLSSNGNFKAKFCSCYCLVLRSQTFHPFLLIMAAGGESGRLSYTKLFPEVRRELGSPTQ